MQQGTAGRGNTPGLYGVKKGGGGRNTLSDAFYSNISDSSSIAHHFPKEKSWKSQKIVLRRQIYSSPSHVCVLTMDDDGTKNLLPRPCGVYLGIGRMAEASGQKHDSKIETSNKTFSPARSRKRKSFFLFYCFPPSSPSAGG